ncbi:MAG TPA: RtcB family protein [Spirochaetota bacterium]|nr:RtcB family protein [Spirochaetota bacterium]
MKPEQLQNISEYCYEIPKSARKGMRVPARIYANAELIRSMDDAVFEQSVNVAMLPGIRKYALCMPDGHSGYGFPVGGVAAIDPEDGGVISPGGIGFDINCGIRLMATSLTLGEVREHIQPLVDRLFARVPSGVGAAGEIVLKGSKLDEAMVKGARWAVQNGYGDQEDLEYCEENGCMDGADPQAVSQKARERGKNQTGTLGSGNHFLEIQVAKKAGIHDEKTARAFGVDRDDQILVMIHSGSRATGHQIATDYLQRFLSVQQRYGISLPDRELACAPLHSDEGQAYFGAMNCAINIAFLNRQLIMHRVREVFADHFNKSPRELGLRLIYDVCHNTAKLENHEMEGKTLKLLVHRKGATRAFAPGMKGVPERYMPYGQPVIVGGSMETGSYLCTGTAPARESFYSTVHGSGRLMSRTQARRRFNGRDLQRSLSERGIHIRTASFSGLAEEAGGAYKDIDAVVGAAFGAGLCAPVARLVPLGSVKG